MTNRTNSGIAANALRGANYPLPLSQVRALLCNIGLQPATAEDTIFSLLNLDVLKVTGSSTDFESSLVELGHSADLLDTALENIFAPKQPATRSEVQPKRGQAKAIAQQVSTASLCATLPLHREKTISGKKIYLIRHAIGELIGQAQSSLEIASPYLDTHGMSSLEDVLRRAASAGVNLKVLTRIDNLSEPDSTLIQGLFHLFKIFGRNFEAANLAYTIKHPSKKYVKVTSALHAKIVVCDREAAYIGSADLRHTALHKNFEVGMILRESVDVEAVADLFDTAWADSVPIDPHYIKREAGL